MSKRIVSVLIVSILIVVEAAPARPQNMILFGWDGAQRDHIDEALSRGELPTLKKMGEQGAYVKIDIEGTTDTKAGWSQILTGYYPKVTGVYSNGRYQPVPVGLSIFERLETHFGTDDFVTVAVIGKKGHCGANDPPKKVRLA
ncbi:MAG: alkaline phosphatase family protein, partial [Planctomycetota bacterium]